MRVCAHICVPKWAPKCACLVQYCYLGSSIWGSVSVCVCDVPVLRTSWAFRDCTCVCMCLCVRLFVRRDCESSSRILLLQSETHCFDWADKLARSPQSAIFPLKSLPSSLLHCPPPSPSHSVCAKDSGSRRQWWGTYQCEPECRLVPSPGRDTHKYRHIHTDTSSVSSYLLFSPSSVYVSVYPCERYQAEVNNVLSTIDLSGRSYGWERGRVKWRGEESMLFCTPHLHTVLYHPIRSLVFCSLIDYSWRSWVLTKEEKQAQHGVLAGSHICGLRRQQV